MAKKELNSDTGMQLLERDDYGDRPFNLHLDSHAIVTDPQSFTLDPFGGTGATFRGKEIFDLEGVVGQIDSGTAAKLPNDKITFAFLDKEHLLGIYNNPTVGFTAAAGLGIFSAAQKAAARTSITLWDDLIAPTFVESKTKGAGADIVFANSADPAQAYAYYPTKQGYNFQSDVFIADPALNVTNKWFSAGGYGITTLVHEIGHSIGLSHPGAYNFDPNVPQTYLGLAEYAQDSNQYSIMSYWIENETGGATYNWGKGTFNNPQTPMLHDILTAQAKYGADRTTRATDTVYGFNSTAGRDVFDFSQNKWPFAAVYDAGGKDTIDLSGFTASQFLDLHDGAFSSIGQAIPSLAEINQGRAALSAELGIALNPRSATFIANLTNQILTYSEAAIKAQTGEAGVFTTQYDNFAIAYGTVIENAIGGSARDVIWGNQVANRLEGRGGNDVIRGFEGNDTLLGGDGNDRLDGDQGQDVLTGGAGLDTFGFDVVERGDRVTDFQTGIDKIDLLGIRNAGNTASFDFTWVGGNAFSGAAGELRYAGGVLEADLNGDRIADLSITVDGNPPLVQSDVLFG